MLATVASTARRERADRRRGQREHQQLVGLAQGRDLELGHRRRDVVIDEPERDDRADEPGPEPAAQRGDEHADHWQHERTLLQVEGHGQPERDDRNRHGYHRMYPPGRPQGSAEHRRIVADVRGVPRRQRLSSRRGRPRYGCINSCA